MIERHAARAVALLFALPMAALVVRAVADEWRAPALVPQRFGLRGFDVALAAGDAFAGSLAVALISTALALLVAWPAARVLGERRLRRPGLVFLLLAMPLLVSPYATGAGLTEWFIRLGLAGTLPGLVLAHLVLVLPYVVVVLLSGFGPRVGELEEMGAHVRRVPDAAARVGHAAVAAGDRRRRRPTRVPRLLEPVRLEPRGRRRPADAAAGAAAVRPHRSAGRGRAGAPVPGAGARRAGRRHPRLPLAAVSALVCNRVVVSAAGAPVLRGVDLAVEAGSRTALVGPSGAGKTTLLRAVAGLAPVDAGDIRLGTRSLAGVRAHRRRIAVVFQEPRLLPHLDVVDNVAFGLRAAGVGRAERRRRARALLDDVGLGGFADRRVRGLSGGEQQRVALARALCAEPDLLMLDEPLAAVDPNRREGLRRLIVDLQRHRGVTTLLITHDRAEAAELGEQVALMLEGGIVQHAPPRELFERPATAAVARFFGVANVLRGEVRAGRLGVGGFEVPVAGGDGPATFAIRPEHVEIGDGPLGATVVEAVYAGTHVRLTLQAGSQRLEAHAPSGDIPPCGAQVTVKLPVERLWRIPSTALGAPAPRAGRP